MPNPFSETGSPTLDKCNCFTVDALIDIVLAGAAAGAPPLPLTQEEAQACLYYAQAALSTSGCGARTHNTCTHLAPAA